MGKSTTANLFAEQGIPVYDADKEVHRIYRDGSGARALRPLFSQQTYNDIVNANHSKVVQRDILRQYIQRDPDLLGKIESVIHPLLQEKRTVFLRENRNSCMCVMDIPLLFETRLQSQFDYIVVVTAPYDVQRARVLARPTMTTQSFERILARQYPDIHKRASADFVIETHHGIEHTRKQVLHIIDTLKQKQAVI